MLAVDLLSGLLGAALAFLVLSVGLIVASQPPVPPRPGAPRPLPQRATPRAVGRPDAPGPSPSSSAPRGQIGPPADSRPPSERSSLEVATELARDYADNDPQRIVEVISFWMREEVAERLEQAARMQSEYLDMQEASARAKPGSSPLRD